MEFLDFRNRYIVKVLHNLFMGLNDISFVLSSRSVLSGRRLLLMLSRLSRLQSELSCKTLLRACMRLVEHWVVKFVADCTEAWSV